MGTDAVPAWTGPRKEAHDFRFGTRELESENDALAGEASQDKRFGPARPLRGLSAAANFHSGRERLAPGAGSSIGELISEIKSALATTQQAQDRSVQLLSMCGYVQEDEPQYDVRYTLANPPRLIRIVSAFPSLTRERVASISNMNEPNRILEADYVLDASGLGVEYGTEKFELELGMT